MDAWSMIPPATQQEIRRRNRLRAAAGWVGVGVGFLGVMSTAIGLATAPWLYPGLALAVAGVALAAYFLNLQPCPLCAGPSRHVDTHVVGMETRTALTPVPVPVMGNFAVNESMAGSPPQIGDVGYVGVAVVPQMTVVDRPVLEELRQCKVCLFRF